MLNSLTLARLTAALLALVVLAWQVGNAAAGRFVHPFLVADLIVSAWLLLAASWPNPRPASLALLPGFGAMLGVFLSAVTARLLAGHLDPGTLAAAVGILPCLSGMVLAGRSASR
ncbi:hypothetical protein AB1L88_23430 [Tautonia sp. JC769]|uniref:hypothetical protein n=1 Tax=Tautonia sp. JC769 TaxID=3232135 RepID=UPI003458FCAF